MKKKQVASWIVAGVLVAGAGAALAEEDPVVTDSTVPTTVVDETTTTEAPTTTVVDDTTTTTEATTNVAGDDGVTDEVVDGEGHGNSEAAQNHDCDEAWGNHGAWASANAHAMKTGDEVSCDGPVSTVDETATTESVEGDEVEGDEVDTEDVEDVETDEVETTATTTDRGNGHGGGSAKGHGKDR